MQNNNQNSIKNFVIFFTKKLRLGNPWSYKAPLLITFPYLVFLLSNFNHYSAVYSVLAACIVITGVAGIGYLTNDLGDHQKDKLAGKENALINMSFLNIVTLFVLFTLLVMLPWVYLPFTKTSAILLSIQFMLFFMYAFPPFRLKEKGVLGLITDALYAHVVPAMLATYTFYVFCMYWVMELNVYLLIVSAWQAALGVRNILFHQLKDFESDKTSGIQTFVTRKGITVTQTLLDKFILPFETILFFFFLILLAVKWQQPLALAFTLLYFVIIFLRRKHNIKTMDTRARAYLFLDDFYIQWLPLVVLFNLSLISYVYLFLLLVHIILFRNGIKLFVINKFPKLRSK